MKQHAPSSRDSESGITLLEANRRPPPPPRSLLNDGAISHIAFRLYCLMQQWCADRTPFPARHKMAEELGVSLKSIGTALNDLDPTYIRRTRSYKGGVNTYELVALAENGEPDTTQPLIPIVSMPVVPKGIGEYGVTFHDFFFPNYPCKVGMEAARKEWIRRRPDAVMITAVLEAIKLQYIQERWDNPATRDFVMNPTRWLEEAHWEDKPDAYERYAPTTGKGNGEALDNDYYKKLAADMRQYQHATERTRNDHRTP